MTGTVTLPPPPPPNCQSQNYRVAIVQAEPKDETTTRERSKLLHLPLSTAPLSVPNILIPPILLRLNTRNLSLKRHDILSSLLNACSETMWLLQPTRTIRHGFLASSEFLLDFLAKSTFVWEIDCAEDHFHSASFTCAVFSVAVLFEVSPLPVTAGELVAFEEAHVWLNDVFCC